MHKWLTRRAVGVLRADHNELRMRAASFGVRRGAVREADEHR
jgi:hypothetical protein